MYLQAEGEQEAFEIYLDAMRQITSDVRRARGSQKTAGLIVQCKFYVDHGLYNKLTVASVAAALGVSPNHLSAKMGWDHEYLQGTG